MVSARGNSCYMLHEIQWCYSDPGFVQRLFLDIFSGFHFCSVGYVQQNLIQMRAILCTLCKHWYWFPNALKWHPGLYILTLLITTINCPISNMIPKVPINHWFLGWTHMQCRPLFCELTSGQISLKLYILSVQGFHHWFWNPKIEKESRATLACLYILLYMKGQGHQKGH